MSYLIVALNLPESLVAEEARREEKRRAETLEHCAWCWAERHPGYPYPDVTSHICPGCKQNQMTLLSVRRAARAVCSKEAIA